MNNPLRKTFFLFFFPLLLLLLAAPACAEAANTEQASPNVIVGFEPLADAATV